LQEKKCPYADIQKKEAMGRKLTSILRIGLALMLGACAAQHKPQELSEKIYFVTFAEGFTADSESEDPRIAWRAFTAPDLAEMRARMRIDSLVVHPRRIRIRVGEVFSLEKLIITALDSNGKLVRRIPFSLAYAEPDPDIIETQKENAHLIKGKKAGEVDLRITSMIPCSDGKYPTAFVRIYIFSQSSPLRNFSTPLSLRTIVP
jgi:hypothetical protein